MSQESIIQFPCDFPIKAMGLATAEFDAVIVEIVRRHAPDIGEGAVTSRPSANGKYVSITVTVRAQSRAQLDAIYMDLTACKQVLWAL
jgi:hypothetical protein